VWKKQGDVPLWQFLGRLHSGHPCLSLPCFSYKYRGEALKTEGKRKEGEVGGTERKNKKKRKNKGGLQTKKTERKREKNHRKPPAPLPVAYSSSANDNSHHRSALLLFLFFSSFVSPPTSTVYVACEQWRATVHG
jgi:hypothetical protein